MGNAGHVDAHPPTTRRTRVLIVGGGVARLAVARALSRLQRRSDAAADVTLIDRDSPHV